jgi:hypothetical protein
VFTYNYDSTCSTTDGPANINAVEGLIDVGNDIWVQYVAPVSGRFYANMCATGTGVTTSFDSALVIWYDSEDSTNCICPDDPTASQLGLASDEGCSGYWDRGAGVTTQTPILGVGDCVTIQAAGFEAEVGLGSVHVGVEEAACTLAQPPQADPRVTDFGFGTRNRYLSFSTGSTGLNEAMRVKLVDLPPPHDTYNGDTWFVTEPVRLTEASGSDGPLPEPAIWAATLTCTATPFYADWSLYGVVHVYHDAIIPGATYHVQAVADDCITTDEESYSPALVIDNSQMGDIVGDCGVQPCSPPQGVIDFVDISGCVDKFRNIPTAPQKSRADVINSNITRPEPDRKIDFVDISTIVDCFRGSPPPLPGPQDHCP